MTELGLSTTLTPLIDVNGAVSIGVLRHYATWTDMSIGSMIDLSDKHQGPGPLPRAQKDNSLVCRDMKRP